MCRAPLGRPVEKEDNDFDIDEANQGIQGIFEAALNDHIKIVRQMLAQGANNFNHSMVAVIHNGHIEIVRFAQGADAYNSAMSSATHKHIMVMKTLCS